LPLPLSDFALPQRLFDVDFLHILEVSPNNPARFAVASRGSLQTAVLEAGSYHYPHARERLFAETATSDRRFRP
jgi:hypothetical protein